ncbi:MAG TPA: peptide chain release factor-like protein [Treponemataceae bacterium]|nr:peptide chain release factor-like protein [Treponemataceae bacterium]
MNRNLIKESLLIHTRLQFSLSGGAGGQNVNKLNTKVHASVPLEKIEGLTPEERHSVSTRLASRINSSNELYVSVKEERTQERNREIAYVRLEALITGAAKIQKKRKKTKPSKSAVEKRLSLKKIASLKKQNRSIHIET